MQMMMQTSSAPLAKNPDEHEALLMTMHPPTQQKRADAAEEEEEPPQWPLSVVWLASVALAVLLSGLCILEINPARIEAACGTALWPLLLARVVCVAVLTGVQWLERSLTNQPLMWFVNYLAIAYHLVFTIALCIAIQASNVLTCSGCHNALEAAATLTHSYALAIVAWLFLVWDALVTLLLLYYELVPAASSSSSSLL
jgi:hypothetical protein